MEGAEGEDGEAVPNVFANRDDLVPPSTATNESDPDVSASEISSDGKKARLKKMFPGSKLKDKMQQLGSAQEQKLETSMAIPSLQDRLFAR